MGSQKYLVVGRILRPHGVKGQVEIDCLTDHPQRFKKGQEFQLQPPTDNRNSVKIVESTTKKNRLLARLASVDDRGQAEELCGRELTVSVEDAEKPPGSFWHHEVLGCDVETVDGVQLGKVTEIIRTGGADVYVIGGDRKYSIPATKEVVKLIDIDKKMIRIKPLPGLLEL